jgi:hypothetical protein
LPWISKRQYPRINAQRLSESQPDNKLGLLPPRLKLPDRGFGHAALLGERSHGYALLLAQAA